MTSSVMGVENLRLKFPSAQELLFKDLSVHIFQGEKVLFLGPSGCGKSTLLQVLSGIIPHSIDVPVKADQLISSDSWGYVFQDPDTQFCMPYVDEELAFVLENRLIPREQMPEQIQRLLKQVGLEFADPHVNIQTLSQGMKQRLALATVLALEPEILLLDEPTALLDPEGTLQIWETIKQLTTDKTVLIVEHKINEIVDYVDRVVLFSPKGEIIADGEAQHIFSEYKKLLLDYGIWYPEVWEDYIYAREQAESEKKGLKQLAHISETGQVNRVNQVNHTTATSHTSHGGHEKQGSETNDRGSLIILEDFKGFRGQECKIHVPSVEVAPQEWIAIIGENGAGKSTLLLALMQLLKTTGVYHLKGQVITGYQSFISKEMAYVFQNPEFQFVTNSVAEEIAYSLKMMKVPQEKIARKVQEMLSRFELQGKEEQHPYQLSIGQKRRLSVASAMVQEQEILLLDEPTFGQDAKNTFAILEQLERLRKAGTTILMVTHDEQIVRHFATRVWEIQDGILHKDQRLVPKASNHFKGVESLLDQRAVEASEAEIRVTREEEAVCKSI